MTHSNERATVHDLAREAGVSLATVDRVLNGRPGVRPATIEKVEAAVARIGFRRDVSASMLARARDIRLRFILPDGSNQFMAKLAEAISAIGAQVRPERGAFTLNRVKSMDSSALARALDDIEAAECDCAVIVAIDKPDVHAAVARASQRGIKVLTLVSDLPDSPRRAFIGIDNHAAGRTAASLLGRFLRPGDTIGLVAGSLGLADHAARVDGFRAVMAAEYPDIALIGPIEGGDQFALTYEVVRDFLKTHPEVGALYNVGAGNAGLIMAVNETERAGTLRIIAHELTGPTQAGLQSGVIDAILDQNPDNEIRAVWSTARRLVLGPDASPKNDPIEIRVFLRDNLR